MNYIRQSMNMPNAEDWLRCQTSPGLRTYMPEDAFRLYFSLYACSAKLFAETCTRRGCNVRLDQFGDHLLTCTRATHISTVPVTRRNDAIGRYISSVLRTAYSSPVVEPRTPDFAATSRPDIRSLGSSGGEDLLDVTISHPITPQNLRRKIGPEQVAKIRYREKVRDHSDYAAAIGPGAQLVPIVVLITGGWH